MFVTYNEFRARSSQITLDKTHTVPGAKVGNVIERIKDQHLWELLAARTDLQLVTGDKRLFQSGPYAQRIVTPQAFIAALETDEPHGSA